MLRICHIVVLVLGILWAPAAFGQVPVSTLCQTGFGVCAAPVAPVGAQCLCAGRDLGRMIFVPVAPGAGGFNAGPQGNACQTGYGACPMSFMAPIGAPCTCIGPRGRDAGRVVGGW